MYKFFSYISINLFIFFSFSQSVTIKGIAPSYIGSTIKIYSISDYLSKFENIITIEDGCIQAGFGSAVIEFMSDNNYKANVVRLGIPDKFINHGTQKELHKECLYDAETLQKTVVKLVTKTVANVG